MFNNFVFLINCALCLSDKALLLLEEEVESDAESGICMKVVKLVVWYVELAVETSIPLFTLFSTLS